MNNKNRTNNSLSSEILSTYTRLKKAIRAINATNFFQKSYVMSDVKVSAADILAYQIGWGELLIYWYQKGIQGIEFKMPGDGFDTWDYKNIALYFYKKYSHFSPEELLNKYDTTINTIIQMADRESLSGNLDKRGVWNWCTLRSGKQWPLSKWIRVNTIAPYKRAYKLLSSSR